MVLDKLNLGEWHRLAKQAAAISLSKYKIQLQIKFLKVDMKFDDENTSTKAAGKFR